ncbi:MAG: thymidylate synthase [Dehalococcoidia bacterium]
MAAIEGTFFHATGGNLSVAWSRAVTETRKRTRREVSPLLFSFGGLDQEAPEELAAIRTLLDECLGQSDMQSVQTVANTIFPQGIWQFHRNDRHAFFNAYLDSLPDYVGMAPSKNSRGLYFARLIAYGIDPRTGRGDLTHLNQLEFIIQHCNRGVRRSMFQAALFDPSRDQTASAQLGFPCLQHVTFVPDFHSQALTTNAFYATQQLYERAYGNLLGLARLTKFMAKETDLRPAEVNCYVAIEKMDRRLKTGRALDRLLGAVEEAASSEK